MATLEWADAWILFALKLAQGANAGASREELVGAADYINHAIVTDEELAHAIEVLVPMGLLALDHDSYSLGRDFPFLWQASGAENERGVFEQLALLEQALNTASAVAHGVGPGADERKREPQKGPAALIRPVGAPISSARAPERTAISPQWSRVKIVLRLWGVLLVLAAFLLMIAEVRWFAEGGTPDATGSARANWGVLVLMSLPWLIAAVGMLQIISGSVLTRQVAWFAAQSLVRRAVVAVGLVLVLVLMTAIVAAVA